MNRGCTTILIDALLSSFITTPMTFLRLFLFAFSAAACARGADLQVVHGWPQVPAGEILHQVAGMGCDSRGDVFVFHRGSRR